MFFASFYYDVVVFNSIILRFCFFRLRSQVVTKPQHCSTSSNTLWINGQDFYCDEPVPRFFVENMLKCMDDNEEFVESCDNNVEDYSSGRFQQQQECSLEEHSTDSILQSDSF